MRKGKAKAHGNFKRDSWPTSHVKANELKRGDAGIGCAAALIGTPDGGTQSIGRAKKM